MAKDLRQFLQVVKEAAPHLYAEIKKPLKPELEVNIIQHKLARAGRYPIIYCHEIEGSKIPLVTNIFGDLESIALALDLDLKIEKSKILQEYMRRVDDPKPPLEIPPAEAPVKEVVILGKDVDLGLLPILQQAELNSGKYMGINPLICRDPVTGILNAGVYRHQLRGKDELGAYINANNHGAVIARRHGELGRLMEVAIVIGHHPAAIFGACLPADLDINELEVMGGLLGEPLRVTPAETVALPVPADAEIILEGILDPNDWVTDGPYSEFFGYYGEEMPCYRIRVKAITMRKDAIFHDIDPAHREHNFSMLMPLETAIYKTVKSAIPGLIAVHLPPSGSGCHAYISIKQGVPGEAKRAALAAVVAARETKLVVVVDEDIDIYNDEAVLWAINTRVRGDLDIDIIPGVIGCRLDPSGPYDEISHHRSDVGNMTTKVIIDATKPVRAYHPTRITPNKELWASMNLEDYLI
ncbi:UbiD family decarboxylase [Chloroflexota bacterium]